MTESRSATDEFGSRCATIRTDVGDAEVLAASVRPDNTPEIDTRVECDADGIETVVTTIERETTGSLRTTVDDYVVNLTVAQEVVQAAKRRTDVQSDVANQRSDSADQQLSDADNADHTQP